MKGSPLTPKDKLVITFVATGKPIAKKIANIEHVALVVGRAHEDGRRQGRAFGRQGLAGAARWLG